MLPNFLIIGSQKAGTTSLYHGLNHHPNIFMSDVKELNFFFEDDYYRQGLGEYAKHFARGQKFKAIGEASPGYICHPAVPERIYKNLPDVKLICTVRHPIRRAYSQYWDNRRALRESNTFAETVELYLDDLYEPGKIGYFSRGTYIRYIDRFISFFGRERLLVLVFEDLKRDPNQFYKEIFEFLEVDETFLPPSFEKAFNASAVWDNPFYRLFFQRPHLQRLLPISLHRLMRWGKKIPYRYPPIEPHLHGRLIDFYRPWNDRLARFLDRDLSFWNAP